MPAGAVTYSESEHLHAVQSSTAAKRSVFPTLKQKLLRLEKSELLQLFKARCPATFCAVDSQAEANVYLLRVALALNQQRRQGLHSWPNQPGKQNHQQQWLAEKKKQRLENPPTARETCRRITLC